MRYSREALASIDTCIDDLRNASTIVQTKMAPGETAAVCASRHFQINAAAGPLFVSFVNAVSALMDLGTDGPGISSEDQNDIETTIRQLFEDTAHKGWRQTEADAHHLEAAE